MRVMATGIVHPERAGVSFPQVRWELGDGSWVTVESDASQITVAGELTRVTDHVAAYSVLEQAADAVVSAFAFAMGTGYWVELIQVIPAEGPTVVFGVRPGNLHYEPHGPIFFAARELARRDALFRMALRDYASAIRETFECGAFCYRSIEAIEVAFRPDTGGPGWEAMHAALGTTRARIEQVVKIFADPVRHGNWVSLPSTSIAQRNEMLQVTRDVLERYLRMRGAA